MKTVNKDNKKTSRTGDRLSRKIKDRVRKAYEKEFGGHKRLVRTNTD